MLDVLGKDMNPEQTAWKWKGKCSTGSEEQTGIKATGRSSQRWRSDSHESTNVPKEHALFAPSSLLQVPDIPQSSVYTLIANSGLCEVRASFHLYGRNFQME